MLRPILALDIGATKIIIGLVRGGRVIHTEQYETRTLLRHGGDIHLLLARLQALSRPNIERVAVGFAGPVHGGAISKSVNFQAGVIPDNFPLARILNRRLGVPATVFNDAHCFVTGEAVYGAGQGKRCVVGLTLGTGVGGGIVLNGQLYIGAHDVAGEFGHIPFPSSDTRCGCGQRGHLETVLSGPGLRRLYAEVSGRDEPSEAVVRAARHGDRAARASLAAIEEALVHLLLTILAVWDPDIIVVGGGFARIPKLLINARHRARQLVPYKELRRTAIVPSLLNNNAVLIGAVRLAANTRRPQ